MTSMVNSVELEAVHKKLEEQAAERARGAKRYSRNQLVFRRFLRNKTAIFGVVLLFLIVLLAIFGHSFSDWAYTDTDRGQYLKPPNDDHIFGTDQRGRDIYAMTVEGIRKSLIIGFCVAAIQTVWAAIWGSAAAYFGGWFDKFATWVIDLLLVIPSFLIIAIVSQRFAGEMTSIPLFILLLAGFGWMLTARVTRSLTLSVKNLDYVNSARYMSVPSPVIIARHIIPNISSLLIIDFTLGVSTAVLSETSLSYFGFGIQDPDVSLGALIGWGQRNALTHPWLFVPPAIILVLLLMSVNFIGDGLRDALDPSSKSGGKA